MNVDRTVGISLKFNSDTSQVKASLQELKNTLISFVNAENKTIDNMPKKPTFEKRFLSIQNIVKDSNKK